MFERILVPLDGSETAAAILTQVRRILFYKDAELILVRAAPLPASLDADQDQWAILARVEASAETEKVAAALRFHGARVKTVSRPGDAAELILDVAEEEKASLIAMSTHGRSGIARWTFGSVAEKILHASPVPVLAVRSFVGNGAESKPSGGAELAFKRILVPIDASNLSREVVPSAAELARLFGSHVLLLNVIDPQELALPVPEMTAMYEQFRNAGVSMEPLLRKGDPAREILEGCREQRADLIAMTTHARPGLTRWMLGGVTEKVLRSSPVPLLVVRPSRQKAMETPQREEKFANRC